MARLLPLLLLVLSLGAAADAEPDKPDKPKKPAPLDAQSRDYDQIHLDLRLRVDVVGAGIRGRARLAFRAEVDGLQALRLHARQLKIRAVTDDGGQALPFQYDDSILRIQLPEALAKGQESAVRIVYRARPRRGLWFHAPTERHPHVPLLAYSQGQQNENRFWIPCYDLPDDRFAFDIRLDVAEALDTVSNGVLVRRGEPADGRRVDHWRFRDEAPSYLISIVVAALDQVREAWGEVELEYNAPRGHGAWLPASLGETPRMMAFYSSWLDTPYPWRRYAQTFVWDFLYGGMENVTATTLNMRGLHPETTRPSYEASALVAHELAHMWFGDLVTCRTWQDIWLNEGFATYLTDLYIEHRDGREAFLLRRRHQNRGYMGGTPNPAALKLKRSPRGDQPLELLGGKAYSRGAAILHMLRLELGDASFQEAVRAYLHTHERGTAASEDLRHAIEQTVGRDLQWFFDQWVYGAGYPVLDVRWDAGTGRVVVRQAQSQGGGVGLFRLKLPVRAGPAGETQVLEIHQAQHQFEPQGAKGAPYLRVGVGGGPLARVRLHQGRTAWERLLMEDPDVTGRLDAIQALEEHGTLSVARLGTALAGDASWAVRQAAAEAIGRQHALAPELGAAARGDPDSRVREAALRALGGFQRDVVQAVLVEACRKEAHDYARAAAATSLGRVQAEDAFEVLTDLLSMDSHGDVVRQGALEGLAATGDPRAVPRARLFLDYAWAQGAQSRLRLKALDVMLRLAPDARETHEALVALLDDPYVAMRRQAAEACGTYGVRAARPGLEKLANHDAHWSVRQTAKQAIRSQDKN